MTASYAALTTAGVMCSGALDPTVTRSLLFRIDNDFPGGLAEFHVQAV